MKDKILFKIFGLVALLIIGFISPIVYFENAAISVLNSYFYEDLHVFSILMTVAVVCFSISLLFINKYHIIGVLTSLSGLVLLLVSMLLESGFRIGNGIIVLVIGVFGLFNYHLAKFNGGLSFSIRDICEIGLFVALAIVLDLAFFKIRIGNNGGSISLSMVPLLVVSLRKGFVKGFVSSGIIFGLITCLLDGYGLFTFPLDYLLAFGSMAVIALFRPLIITKNYRLNVKGIIFLVIGVISAVIGRTIFATISGIVFYELDFVASLVYQLTYILPSAAGVLVVMVILYKPILRIEKMYSKS